MSESAYEVKDGEPVPSFMRARKSKYPFYDMEVGEYFDVPREFVKGKATSRAISISQAAKRVGIKVEMALVCGDDNYAKVGQYEKVDWTAIRVWRKPRGGTVPETT